MARKLSPVRESHEFPGSEILADEVEFANAMVAFQQQYQRRYPSWREVLYVLKKLGYQKNPAQTETATTKIDNDASLT